ncbi:MAG TPA: hypothetical protein VFB58_11625 [Chloroflexota bacterium]|nr:hypothetical protein [Chloroflexota bacterium]
MQTQPDSAAVTEETDAASAPPARNEPDELRMLLIGMTLGLTIGGFFLIYVVLAAAGLLR